MATAKGIETKAYCDELLSELAFMIQSIKDLRIMGAQAYGAGSSVFREHDRHLAEMEEYIDWKLQVLTTACPFDWKGLGDGVESIVSVQQPDGAAGTAVSEGYLGG